MPPFLYGTHYSNVGSVLYFLSRMEPYTSNLIDLQSGTLDQPERMFHSMEETWKNVSQIKKKNLLKNNQFLIFFLFFFFFILGFKQFFRFKRVDTGALLLAQHI